MMGSAALQEAKSQNEHLAELNKLGSRGPLPLPPPHETQIKLLLLPM